MAFIIHFSGGPCDGQTRQEQTEPARRIEVYLPPAPYWSSPPRAAAVTERRHFYNRIAVRSGSWGREFQYEYEADQWPMN